MYNYINTSFILVILRLLLKDKFSVAFFQIAFVFESAVSFSRKGRFSIQSSLESSSFGLHLGMVAILSWFVRSKAENSLIPPFLYMYGQFSSVAYFIALPMIATLKVSSVFFRVMRSSLVFRKLSCNVSKALTMGLIAICIGWICFSFMKQMFS